MNKKELIEKLKDMPDDARVLFYDEQYEKVYWDITKVVFEDGIIIMLNDDYGI